MYHRAHFLCRASFKVNNPAVVQNIEINNFVIYGDYRWNQECLL